MTPEEFQHLRGNFERLVAVTGDERARLIQELSESDAVLAEELNRMLAAYASRTSLLDQTATVPMASPSVDFDKTAPVPAGSQLGSYVLESELGRGGMGVVYQARRADGSFQRRVAIKILRHDRIDSLVSAALSSGTPNPRAIEPSPHRFHSGCRPNSGRRSVFRHGIRGWRSDHDLLRSSRR